MTDHKIALVIKAHYDHTSFRPLNSYFNYVGSQVTRRVGNDINTDPTFKGVKFSPKELIDGVFKGDNSYLDYISKRKGSTGMFTDPKIDIASVLKDARNYSGYYFMPYISMRESDARKYGVLSQQDFERVVVAAMREMPEILKINEADFRYLAAFHIKSKEKQNNNGAGKQPHVHLIIWDQSNDRRKFKMSQKEISKFRSVVNKHLFSKHRIQFYAKRNDIRRDILDEVAKLLNEDISLRNELERVKNSLYKIREGSGSLHYGTLIKEFNFLSLNVKAHSSGNDFYSRNIELEMTKHLYEYFFDNIKDLAVDLLGQGNLPKLLKDWQYVSYQMREYEGDKVSRESTQNDFNSLLSVVFNKIIRSSAYQSEIVRDSSILRQVTRLANSGVLKYKNVDPNIGVELARIMFRAVFFEYKGDYSKMRWEVNGLYSLFGDLIKDRSFFYQYHRELHEMNALKSPGLYMEELELVAEYIQIENTYHYPKGYPVHLGRNEWISVDPFGITVHSRKDTAVAEYVSKFRKLEMEKDLERSKVLLEEFRIANEEKQVRSPRPEHKKSLDDLIIFPSETTETSNPNTDKKKNKDKVRRVPKMLDDFDADQKLIEAALEEEIDFDSELEDEERMHFEEIER